MKKILIALAIMISINSFSQQQVVRRANYIKIDVGLGYGSPIKTDVNIVFDTKSEQLIIYSNSTQLFNLVELTTEKYQDGYKLSAFDALDSNHRRCSVELWLSDRKIDVIRVIYKDMKYDYYLEEN